MLNKRKKKENPIEGIYRFSGDSGVYRCNGIIEGDCLQFIEMSGESASYTIAIENFNNYFSKGIIKKIKNI